MSETDARPAAAVDDRAGAPGARLPTGPELLVHADALLRVACELAGSQPEAEDLVQETYVRAVRAIGRFEPGSNLRAWLFRILRNAWIDTSRAAARHAPDAGEGEELPEEVAAEPGAVLRGDDELEQMRGLVSAEIADALARLGPDARTVVLLDLEGFTETEIAEIMTCAVGTVKSRLNRARKALRQRLAEYRR